MTEHTTTGSAITDHSTATLALLEQLVQRPSVTPDDQGCQQLIASRLEALGFSIEPLRFGAVDNLWARFGTTAPLVVFAGHTDVVPTGDVAAWSAPPFEASIHDGHMIGRGTADMKGGVAALVTALERFVARCGAQLRTGAGSVALLLTSDEEGVATDGTRQVVETLMARGETMDFCVLGEPSSEHALGDVIRHGRRGSLGATLLVQGKQGHVAYPHLANNPVHLTAAALAELVAIEWDSGDAHFPPTTLQVSNIAAGTGATNVIPDTLTVTFNLRFGPASAVASIQQRVNSLLRRHALDFTLDWRLSAEPFITEPGRLTDVLQQAIGEHTGRKARLDTGGGTSDGRFIAPTGTELVEFGPVNASIHQIDERVSCQDIATLTLIYERVLEQLLTSHTD